MKSLYAQMLKFMLVGVSSFVIDYAVLWILKEYCDFGYLMASFIAFTVALIYNYILSMRYVFKGRRDMSKRRQFLVFLLLSVVGLIINQYVMQSFVESFHWHYMLAKIVASNVVTAWNFCSRKLFLEERVEDL